MPKWLIDGVLTLVAIYLVQFIFAQLFVSRQFSPEVFAQPIKALPAYIYLSWDAGWYRHFYEVYDRYFWPPLYPFTLRLVSLIFNFESNAFEKSAVLTNLCSHAVIVLGLSYYLQARERTRQIPAWLVAFLLFFYPGHNVFFAAYSESLYLAVAIMAFVLRQKEKLFWASLVAGLSALVRTMGAFVAAALFAEQVFRCWRDRKVYWRDLLLASPGVIIAFGWQGFLYHLGTTVARENGPWAQGLVTSMVPQGMNANLWVLNYLAFSTHWVEVVAFWAGVSALVYCAVKKRYAEMFYIAFFYFSLAIYLYRPFPWSRLVSVLFPLYILVADLLRERPRLTAVVLLVSVGFCYFVQIELFQGRMGEP